MAAVAVSHTITNYKVFRSYLYKGLPPADAREIDSPAKIGSKVASTGVGPLTRAQLDIAAAGTLGDFATPSPPKSSISREHIRNDAAEYREHA